MRTLKILLISVALALFTSTALVVRNLYATSLEFAQTSESTLTVRALIDGRSWLVVQSNTVHWHHWDYAAPGRHEFANEPTLLNGIAWFPVWPDVPDPENRDCHCDSSSFDEAPLLTPQRQTVVLQIVQARGEVVIMQQPDQQNEFTLIVEFDDNAPLGSDWYEVELIYGGSDSNLLRNGEFEDGKLAWQFFTNGQGYFTAGGLAYSGSAAAHIHIRQASDNVQLYQTGFQLQPQTTYRLQFAARSNTGHDLSLYLHKHGAPYTDYGLRNLRLNMTQSWKVFTIEFRTKNFAAPTADARLRFWLAPFDAVGDDYWLDMISLVEIAQTVDASQQMLLGTDTISGRVQLAGDEQTPVRLTLVDLATEGTTYQASTWTEASDAYHFNNIPYGLYELHIQAPLGYLRPEPMQFVVSEDPNEEMNINLDAVTNTVFLPAVIR